MLFTSPVSPLILATDRPQREKLENTRFFCLPNSTPQGSCEKCLVPEPKISNFYITITSSGLISTWQSFSRDGHIKQQHQTCVKLKGIPTSRNAQRCTSLSLSLCVCVCVCVCVYVCVCVWGVTVSAQRAKFIFMQREMMKQSNRSVWLFAFIQVAASVRTVLLPPCSSSQPTHTEQSNKHTHTHTHAHTPPHTDHAYEIRHTVYSHTHTCLTALSPAGLRDCRYDGETHRDRDRGRVASSFTTEQPVWDLSHW